MTDNFMPFSISRLPMHSPSVIALGNFDGVHLGHRAIISAACEAKMSFDTAARASGSVIAWTFNGRPHSGKAALLTTPEYREALLREAGADAVIAADFEAFRDLSPERFVREVLIDIYNCRTAVCGFNYHFGRGGEGDAALLAELMERYGRNTVIVPPVKVNLTDEKTDADGLDTVNEVVVSSSLIRAALSDGQPRDAAVMLGRPYSVCLPVEHGRRMGRMMGFPTINQRFPEGMIEPKRGVYVCSCKVAGTTYRGVANIGVRPTVDNTGDGGVTLETHLFGFKGDLYGACVEVGLLHFMRPEVTFNNMDELRDAIARDATAAAAFIL